MISEKSSASTMIVTDYARKVFLACLIIASFTFLAFLYRNPTTEHIMKVTSPSSILRSLSAKVLQQQPQTDIVDIVDVQRNNSTTSAIRTAISTTDSQSNKELHSDNEVLGSTRNPLATTRTADDKAVSSTPSPVTTTAPPQPKSCSPVTHIVYVKTHKTGSTTLASILERFGDHQDLLFALPKGGHVFSNEKLFSRGSIKPWPPNFAKQHPYYDMLVNHAVYNRPELNKVVPDATYITILRDPVKQLESSFGYFEMAKGMGLSKERKPFETFMNNPMYYYKNTKYKMKTRSRNGQLFDLGFNPKLIDNTKAISAKIDAIDKEFGLVLLTDYFDESLVLMKKLLCWSFDDILYISDGIRSKSHRYSISDDLVTKIRRWNAGDVLLYNHFNETFWRKVKEYGPDFDSDLATFRELNQKVFDKCIDKNNLDVSDRRAMNYKLKKSQASGKYCKDIWRDDVRYTHLLRTKMENISKRPNW